MIKLFMNPEIEEEFRKWARDNYEPFTEIKGIWHPVVQRECIMINIRNGMTEIVEE